MICIFDILVGEVLSEEDYVEQDDDLEGLTSEEIAAILDELDNIDEGAEVEVELHELTTGADADTRDFAMILSVRRIPCTAHKARI